MSELLTPSEVDKWVDDMDKEKDNEGAATLRIYAKIVEEAAVAEPLVTYYEGNHKWITECSSCHAVASNGEPKHLPDCFYLLARRVRGYE